MNSFFKERYNMALKLMKRYSPSFMKREMPIKGTSKCHSSLSRLAKLEKNSNTLSWQGCGETRTLIHC